MTPDPAGLPAEARARLLLPSHFKAALDHVPATVTWYEDIEEALSLPADQEAVWLASVFVPGDHATGLFVAGGVLASGILIVENPSWQVALLLATAVWCFAAYRLVRTRLVGTTLRRYGHVVLPLVLIALGVWILLGARVLLR